MDKVIVAFKRWEIDDEWRTARGELLIKRATGVGCKVQGQGRELRDGAEFVEGFLDLELLELLGKKQRLVDVAVF